MKGFCGMSQLTYLNKALAQVGKKTDKKPPQAGLLSSPVDFSPPPQVSTFLLS